MCASQEELFVKGRNSFKVPKRREAISPSVPTLFDKQGCVLTH